MDNFLDFAGQRWKQSGLRELRFFLYHAPSRPGWVSFDVTITFVPPWLEENDILSEHRTMIMNIHAAKRHPGSWRAFLGERLEFVPPEADEEGCRLAAGSAPPEVRLTSCGSGQGAGSVFFHANEFWDVGVTLGEPPPDDSFLLPITVEGFQPSQRAQAAQASLFLYPWLKATDDSLPSEEELEARLEEGRWLRYEGAVYFVNVHCSVPVNAADPVAWAQALAKRELGMTEFGNCEVLGTDWKTGKFKPEDGVSDSGRSVLLSPRTASWKEQQRRHAEREKFIAEQMKRKKGGTEDGK